MVKPSQIGFGAYAVEKIVKGSLIAGNILIREEKCIVSHLVSYVEYVGEILSEEAEALAKWASMIMWSFWQLTKSILCVHVF